MENKQGSEVVNKKEDFVLRIIGQKAKYKPGTVIQQPSGDKYIVGENGSWRRVK